MRYLFVEPHPVFGGPQRLAIRLQGPLAIEGWETVVALPDERGSSYRRLAQAGVELAPIPMGRIRRNPIDLLKFVARFPLDVWRLRQVIRRKQIDLVVIAGFDVVQGAIAGKLAGVPTIWQINGTQTPMAYRRVMMPIARRLADVLMTTGTSIEEQLPGLTKARDRWIPFLYPVNIHEFAPDAQRRERVRAELGIGAAELAIGTVGNLNVQKGHETFVRAAALVHRRCPDVKFVIFGESDPNHHAYQVRVRGLVSQLGLEDHLMILAPGERVADLASALDIFWSTSVPRSEGVPTAVMEGMALSVPVVATDVGGLRDIVKEGTNGFLVPPLDPHALERATLPLIKSPTLRRALGRNAREFAVAECRTERSVAAHLRAFQLALRRAEGDIDGRLTVSKDAQD